MWWPCKGSFSYVLFSLENCYYFIRPKVQEIVGPKPEKWSFHTPRMITPFFGFLLLKTISDWNFDIIKLSELSLLGMSAIPDTAGPQEVGRQQFSSWFLWSFFSERLKIYQVRPMPEAWRNLVGPKIVVRTCLTELKTVLSQTKQKFS